MGHHQLTDWERYLIGRGKSRGDSVRQIARDLERSASTISRELRRNADTNDGRYRVEKAISYAKARRSRSRKGSSWYDRRHVQEVHRLVQRKWSPEQVSRRLRKLGRASAGVSTIYRWLAKDRQAGGRSWLQTRQLSNRYRKGYGVQDCRGKMSGKRPLEERPKKAQDRSEVSHI